MDDASSGPTRTTHLDSSAVHELLAHRYPFLMVDAIDIVEPGRRVIGCKQISVNEWWGIGYESRDLYLPLGFVVEGLAQTSGALVRDLAEGMEGAVAYFMGVNRVRLRGKARPGDTMQMEVRLTQWRRGICRTRGEARVNGRLIVSAELTTIVRASR